MDFVIKGLVAVLILSSVDNPIWTDSMTDQEKCQAEADYMAKIMLIVTFINASVSLKVSDMVAVTPRSLLALRKYKMTLTGDASAQSPNGKWVRVRSWR